MSGLGLECHPGIQMPLLRRGQQGIAPSVSQEQLEHYRAQRAGAACWKGCLPSGTFMQHWTCQYTHSSNLVRRTTVLWRVHLLCRQCEARGMSPCGWLRSVNNSQHKTWCDHSPFAQAQLVMTTDWQKALLCPVPAFLWWPFASTSSASSLFVRGSLLGCCRMSAVEPVLMMLVDVPKIWCCKGERVFSSQRQSLKQKKRSIVLIHSWSSKIHVLKFYFHYTHIY